MVGSRQAEPAIRLKRNLGWLWSKTGPCVASFETGDRSFETGDEGIGAGGGGFASGDGEVASRGEALLRGSGWLPSKAGRERAG